MTRLVVIGRSGQVAAALRHVDLPKGWLLVSLGRSELDLVRPDSMKPILATLEPNIVINAAAYTAVDQAESEEQMATLVNAEAPGELARVAADFGIPLINLSTDYVFDGTSSRSWREEDESHPLNAYGRSKLAGERAVLDSAARAVILRTSWVFSSHGSNFVKTMLHLGAENKEVSVVSDQQGGPTPAQAVAEAVLKIATNLVAGSGERRHGVYHFSGAPPTSWAGFAKAIFEGAVWLSGKPRIREVSTAEYSTRAQRPRNSVLDCSKIKQDYGLEQPDWRVGLDRTLAELRPEAATKRA
jgi:dTDP-4-dehydrorhamnose reductase